MDVQTILSSIQKNLKAPKSQRNTFGNYNYRNAEDILEAVKPLLEGSILTITDEIVLIGTRYYIKATATLTAGKDSVSAVAYAREPEIQKGMNDSQITGSASSYARKYALNGLFCIDDTKDADSQDNREEKPTEPKTATGQGSVSDKQLALINTLITKTGTDRELVKAHYKVDSLTKLTVHNGIDLITQLKAKEQNANKISTLPTKDEISDMYGSGTDD